MLDELAKALEVNLDSLRVLLQRFDRDDILGVLGMVNVED